MASQVIIACGTKTAPDATTPKVPAGEDPNVDSKALPHEIATRTVYIKDDDGNWMVDAPVAVYLTMPPDMAATFSTGMGAEPKKILKDLLPPGRKLVHWSADDLWERARSLRARFPAAVEGMFEKPQAWADLFAYYDSEDLYFLGAYNVWNLVNLIVEINLAMLSPLRQDKMFVVQNWVEDWISWEGNRMMLECWDPSQSQNILDILSDFDRKQGGCGDFQQYEDEQMLKLALEKRYAEWINTGSHGNQIQSWLDSTVSPAKTTSPPPLDSIPEDAVPVQKARVFGRNISAPVSGLQWDMTNSVSAHRSSSQPDSITKMDDNKRPLGDITSQALNVEVKPETKAEPTQGIKEDITASAPQESSKDSNKENDPPSTLAPVASAEDLTITSLAEVGNVVAGQPSAVKTMTQPEMMVLDTRQTQDHYTAVNTRNNVPPTTQPGTNFMQKDWSQFPGGQTSFMEQLPAPASVNDTGPHGYSNVGRPSNTTSSGLPHGLQPRATNLQNQPASQYATVENSRGFAGPLAPQVHSARFASESTDRSRSFGQPQSKSPPRSAGWQPKRYDVLHGRVYSREGGGTSSVSALAQSSNHHTTPPRNNTGRVVSESSPPGCVNAGRRGLLVFYAPCYCSRCGPRQRAVFVNKFPDFVDLKNPAVKAKIAAHFSEFGAVQRVEAHPMRQTAFVFFETEDAAHAAVTGGHRQPIEGLSDCIGVNYPVFSQFFKPRNLYQGHVPNYHSTKVGDKYRPQRPSQQDRSQKYYLPPAQHDAYREPEPTGFEKRWSSNPQSRHASPNRAQVRQFQQPGYELPLGNTRQGHPPTAGPAGDVRAGSYAYPGVGGYSAGPAPQDGQPYYPPSRAGSGNMGMPPPNAFRQPELQLPAEMPSTTGLFMLGEPPVYYPQPTESFVPSTNFDFQTAQLPQPLIKFPPKDAMGAFGSHADRNFDPTMTTPTKTSKGKKKFKKPVRAVKAHPDQQDANSAEENIGTVIRRKPVPKASILQRAATSGEESMEEKPQGTVIRRKPVPKARILPSAAATSAEESMEESNMGTVIRRKQKAKPSVLPDATTPADSSDDASNIGTVVGGKSKQQSRGLPSVWVQGESGAAQLLGQVENPSPPSDHLGKRPLPSSTGNAKETIQNKKRKTLKDVESKESKDSREKEGLKKESPDSPIKQTTTTSPAPTVQEPSAATKSILRVESTAKSTRLTSLPKGFDPFPRISSHRKLPSTTVGQVQVDASPPKEKAPATPPKKAPAVAPTPSPEQKIVVNEATPPPASKATPPAECRTPSLPPAELTRRAASDTDIAALKASPGKRPALTASILQALDKPGKATPLDVTSLKKQDVTKLVVSTPSEAKSRETSYETAKTHLSPESSPGEGSDRSAASGKGKQKQKLRAAGSGSPTRPARASPSRPSTPTAISTGTQTSAPLQGNNNNNVASPTKTSPLRNVKKWKSPAKDAGSNAGASKAPNERPAKPWAKHANKASAPAFNMSNFPALPVNKTRDASDATQAARVHAWAEKRKMKEEIVSPSKTSASGSDKE